MKKMIVILFLVSLLITEGFADVNSKFIKALYFATKHEKLELLQFILSQEKEVDINANYKYGEALLHWAVENSKLKVVKFLLSKGADINVKDKDGNTPLNYAIDNKNINIVEYLISKGANVNTKDNKGKTPLHYAVTQGKFGKRRFTFLQRMHKSSQNKKNAQIYFQIVKLLVLKGANINVKDINGKTPLHYAMDFAILSKNFNIVKYLISKGANVNAKDNNGETILHYAVKSGNFMIMKYLISNGANVKIKNNSGKTPLELTKTIVDWEKIFNFTRSDVAKSIIQTKDGNFIVIGSKEEKDKSDAFVIKLNNKGNILWKKTFINVDDSYDNANSVIQTKDGDFIVVGKLNYGAWIVKIDKKGNKIWEKVFSSDTDDGFSDIIETKNGELLLVGDKENNDDDAWLIKLDKKGNKIWEKVFDEQGEFSQIIQTKDNSFIAVGETSKYDMWILKLDNEGNKIWEKVFGGEKYDRANSVVQTKDGKIVIAGCKNRDDSKYTSKMWIVALDKNGNKLWDKTFGTEGKNEAYSIIQSKDGNLIVAGKTESTHKAKGLGSSAWIIKLDTKGNKIWDTTFSKFSLDIANSIIQTKDGSFVVAGVTKSSPADNRDIWVFKFYEPNKEDGMNKEDLLNLLTPLLKERNLYTQEYIDASKKYIDKLIEKYGKEKAEKVLKILIKKKPALVIKMIKGFKDDLSNNQSDNNTTNTNASQENSNVSIDNNQKTDESSKQENSQLTIEDKIKSFLNDFYTTTQYNDLDKVLSFYSDNPKRFFPLKNPTKEMIKQKQLKYTQKWPNREYSLVKIELLDNYTKDSKKYYIVKAYIKWKVSSDSKSVKGQSEHLVTLVEENGKFLIDSITAVAINRHSSG